MTAAAFSQLGISSARSARKRSKQKGRATEWSFVSVPHYILKSPEFGQLTGYGVKLLFELAKEYKGKNNGDFSAAYSVLRRRGWRSPSTLSIALKELREKGWIVTTRHGGRHRCSLYAVTWWPIDDCDGKLEVAAESKPRNYWKTESPVAIRTPAVSTCIDEGLQAA